MSYMSDVKVVMLKSEWDLYAGNLIRRAMDNWQNDEDLMFKFDMFLKNVKENNQNDVIILSWDYFKWDYDTNEIIADFIDYLSNSEKPFKFIRVGEGVGTLEDIEEHAYYGKDEMYKDKIDLIDIKREVKIVLNARFML